MPIPHETVAAVTDACAAGNPCRVSTILAAIPRDILTVAELAEINRLQLALIRIAEQTAQSNAALEVTRVGTLCSLDALLNMTNLTLCQDDQNSLASALMRLGFTVQPASNQGSYLRYNRVASQRRAPIQHRNGSDRGAGEPPSNTNTVTPRTDANILAIPASKTLEMPQTQNPKGLQTTEADASSIKRRLSNTIAPSAGLIIQASGANNIAEPIRISGKGSKPPFQYNSPGRATIQRSPTRPMLPYGMSPSTIKLPASATGASSLASKAIADFNMLAGKHQPESKIDLCYYI